MLFRSSSSSSSSSSSARGGHGQHAKAMGLMPTGRDSAAAAAAAATSDGSSGGSARDLGSPLVATLFSWPKTLAMLSQHYSSPERDADSFFHLLEPFHTKESKFRRCMRELLPHTVNSGSSSGSGSTRGGGPSSRPGRGSSSRSGGGGSGSQGTHQKLLLKVHRGEALRGDVFAQLAELRAQNDKDDDSSTPSSDSGSGGDDEGAGSATSSGGAGGGGRPWLCRHLEDTKPWFVDGMGEGKGVVRALVAEFAAAVTTTTTAAKDEQDGDGDGSSAVQPPLLVPCPADTSATATVPSCGPSKVPNTRPKPTSSVPAMAPTSRCKGACSRSKSVV